VAVFNRTSTASALVALSISAIANGQQAPATGEEIDTVVVTGVRESLRRGLENKRESTQVIESIVAEDIGKLPDNNVIEALQRVTGVQVSNRGGGEADAISIRGLPDIATTWNGRNIFTASGRQLQLQDIPANLVGRIDVFKTRAAEQLETGLAGQIDVRTHRPFDLQGFEMSVNGRVTRQQQAEENDPTLSLLVSNTWNLGSDSRFGALVNVSYTRVHFRDQSVTAGAMVPFASATTPPLGYGAAADNCPNTPPDNPNFTPLERIFNTNCRATLLGQPAPLLWQAGLDRGLSWEPGSTLNIAGADYEYLLARDALFATDSKGDRERPAANLSLQFAPNETSEYTFEAFYPGYRNDIFNNLHFTFADWWGDLGPTPANTYTLYPDTNVVKTRTVGDVFRFQSGDGIRESTDSYVYALNGKWSIGEKLTLVADAAFQDSTFDTNFIAMRTIRIPGTVGQIMLDFNAGGGIPSWHYTDDAAMLDPANWEAAELFQNRGRNKGDATTLQLDGDYAFAGDAEGAWFKRLKFGVRYDDRSSSQANPRPVAADFLGGSFTNVDESFYYTNRNFMDGNADVPTSWLVPNGWYILDHRDELRALYGQPAGDPTLIEAFNVEEKTSSVYVQADMNFGEKLDIQAGLRFVSVDTDMAFTDVITEQFSTESKSVDDVMPSVTVRYSITPDFRLRFNYGETLRRPNFVDLNANFALTDDLTNVGYGTGTGGNPDLEAAKSKNYDLTAEWYFTEDSAIYGTLFRREIDGLVVPLTRRITIPDTGLTVDEFIVTQPVNASDGELEGIELGFVWFPDLPGALNGLGLQGSLTKLDSTQNIPQTNALGEIIGQETTGFFGVSDMSYNITLAYDRAGFGGRLSYVWRDDFINNNEGRQFANPIGIWRRPEQSLDLQLNYDFNENLAVSFDAVNLGEDMQQSYYRFADVGNPTVSNFGTTLISRSFSLGVRWKY
jgi:iron complex outermembrane receptor protein